MSWLNTVLKEGPLGVQFDNRKLQWFEIDYGGGSEKSYWNPYKDVGSSGTNWYDPNYDSGTAADRNGRRYFAANYESTTLNGKTYYRKKGSRTRWTGEDGKLYDFSTKKQPLPKARVLAKPVTKQALPTAPVQPTAQALPNAQTQSSTQTLPVLTLTAAPKLTTLTRAATNTGRVSTFGGNKRSNLKEVKIAGHSPRYVDQKTGKVYTRDGLEDRSAMKRFGTQINSALHPLNVTLTTASTALTSLEVGPVAPALKLLISPIDPSQFSSFVQPIKNPMDDINPNGININTESPYTVSAIHSNIVNGERVNDYETNIAHAGDLRKFASGYKNALDMGIDPQNRFTNFGKLGDLGNDRTALHLKDMMTQDADGNWVMDWSKALNLSGRLSRRLKNLYNARTDKSSPVLLELTLENLQLFKLGGSMINKYENGGATDQQMIQAMVEVVKEAAGEGKVSDEQAMNYLKQLASAASKDLKAAQLMQEILAAALKKLQTALTTKALHGAKLNYIKRLQGNCPDGEISVMFKAGGKVCQKCMKKKAENGSKLPKEMSGKNHVVNPNVEKDCGGGTATVRAFKAKCGKKLKKIVKDADPAGPLKPTTVYNPGPRKVINPTGYLTRVPMNLPQAQAPFLPDDLIHYIPEVTVVAPDKRPVFDRRYADLGNGRGIIEEQLYDYYGNSNDWAGDGAGSFGSRTIYVTPERNDTIYSNPQPVYWDDPLGYEDANSRYISSGNTTLHINKPAGNLAAAKNNFQRLVQRSKPTKTSSKSDRAAQKRAQQGK